MTTKLTLNVPLNRVEGDLEVKATIEDNVCQEARCVGTMFRGFERILEGRGPLDGLVITPRICGICSTGHLTAAAKALEALAGVRPPAKAVMIRNVALMTEHLQSDLRQSIMTFAVDFTNEAYSDNPLYEEATRRYSTFKGTSFLEVLRESKRILELVAIVGGQWPHSTFMVPGGITSLPAESDLRQCQLLLRHYREWYERQILGCSLERWLAVEDADQLEAWLEEAPAHRDSEVGFLIRYGRSIGLDGIGQGPQGFLSVGSLELPQGTEVRGRRPGTGHLVPPGFANAAAEARAFDQAGITEHVAASWFKGEPGGIHPSEGTTIPYATGDEGSAYSWCKAPRYEGEIAETGPLAEAVIAGHPLFCDLVRRNGASALTRQLARLVRPVELMPAMHQWLSESLRGDGGYRNPGSFVEGEGIGLTHASRGALGHWIRLKDSRIDHYQIITPTAWNASPRDTEGVAGPMEQALQGTPVANPDVPIELGHVIRSFDPCLVCTVHRLDRAGRTLTSRRLEI